MVLNCIMDIHRNVYMWGQQDLLKREMTAGKNDGHSLSLVVGGSSKYVIEI